MKRTKEQTIKSANEFLAKMKTSGWKIRVWENFGWQYKINHPCGISLFEYEEEEDEGEFYYVPYFACDNKGGDESIWHVGNKDNSNDPNKAIELKLKYVKESINPYLEAIDKLEKLVKETK